MPELNEEQQARLSLVRENVLYAELEPADIVLAMNFSYYLFLTRDGMLSYFRSVREGLMDDGIFFLDAYGGYDAPKNLVEERECDEADRRRGGEARGDAPHEPCGADARQQQGSRSPFIA